MKCISPLKASQNINGDIVYSSKKALPGLVGIEFECRRCLPCRLNIAREKSIRALHEAKEHEGNIFLTLTYDEDSLASEKLIYKDFQDFIRKLRDKLYYEHRAYELKNNIKPLTKRKDLPKISYMVTGEYGELNKRPHWHAILFNYWPNDADSLGTTKRGDQIWTSKTIEELWGKGRHDFGSVTLDSAGYVARYASKKLVHGKDEEHDYHPIHKVSSARAIGRSWIEKYHQHTFENGYVVLPNGQMAGIPRYYVDWCKKYKPELYVHYVTEVRPKVADIAEKQARKEEMEFLSNLANRKGGDPYPEQRKHVKLRVLESKFKRLMEFNKL